MSELEDADQREANRKRIMAEMRQLLADMSTKQHWHGGPNPCEVCGGMKGTLGKLDQREGEAHDGAA